MLKARFLLGLFLIVGAFASCKKELSPEKQAAKDDSAITDFIAKNNLVATKHSSGIYYQIITPGDGNTVLLSNTVSVNYEGRLLDGSLFDKSGTTATFPLSNLIRGWQIGIPLIKKGGKIRLILPSALGYGNQSPSSKIPSNSVLDFTIELVNAQ
jgi:FKBP-type peptidyl-prolyl cis-trans isomerase FkpA